MSGQDKLRTRSVLLSAAAGAAWAGAVLALSTGARANTADNVTATAANAPLDSAASYSGGLPVAGSDVVFAAGIGYAGSFTLNAAPLSIGTLNDLSGSAITLTGTQTITLNGGTNTVSGSAASDLLYVATGATLNLNAPLALTTAAASGNFDVVGTASIGSAIAGTSFGFTKTGSGTLTLGAANTYTGGTTLSAGTLNINNAGTSSANSALGTGTFTIAGGTINNTSGSALTLATNNVQQWNGDFAFTGTSDLNLGTGAVTLGAARVVTVNGGTLTVGGTIGGTQDLTKKGAGTLTLSGGTSSTPSAIVQFFASGGTANITGFLNTSLKFVANGGTVNFSGTGTQSGSYNGVGDNATGTLNITAGTFNSNPASATFVGNGTTGQLTVSGGSFIVGTNTQVSLGNGYNNNGGGTGTLTVSGAGLFSTGVTTGNFTLGSSTTTAGTGTINLDGGTFATNRALVKGAGSGSAAIVNFNGGTFQALGTAAAIPNTITGNIRNGGATFDSNGFSFTIAQNLVHSTIAGDNATDGGLTKKGSGTLTLAGTNTYNGSTLVNVGTLTLGALGALNGNGTVAVASGAMLEADLSGTYTNIGTVTISGTGVGANAGALNFRNGNSANTVWSAPLTLSGAATLHSFGVSMTQTLGAAIGGTGPLTIGSRGGSATAHTAVWNLNAASTYSGNTLLLNDDGIVDVTLKLGVDNALPTTTGLTLEGSTGSASQYTTFDLNAHAQTVASLVDVTLAGTNGKRVINSGASAGTLTINNASADTYNGTLGGNTAAGVAANNLKLTKSAAGTLTLGGANTYTGATSVTAGTLKAGVASFAGVSGAFGNNSAVSLANTVGATLDITGYNTQIGSLTGGGTTGGNVTLGAATLTVGGDNTSPAAYAGVLAGTGGGLTKIGTGSLTLSGTNTYTGPTAVNAGKLSVASGGTINVASNIAVASGAELNVVGTVAGVVTLSSGGLLTGTGTTGSVSAGGTVSPGASGAGSVGTLTSTAVQTWAGGGKYIWDLANPAGSTPGTDWDLVQMSTLNVSATSGNTFTIAIQASNGVTPNQPYTIAHAASVGNPSGPAGAFDPAAFVLPAPPLAGESWQIQEVAATGGGFDVQVTETPEPGAAGLLAIAGLGLLRRRRARTDPSQLFR